MLKIKIFDNFWENSKSFEANFNDTVLDQINNAGFDIAFSCMNWTCWICTCYILSGKEFLTDVYWNEISSDTCLTCSTYIKSWSEWEVHLQTVF